MASPILGSLLCTPLVCVILLLPLSKDDIIASPLDIAIITESDDTGYVQGDDHDLCLPMNR